MSKRKMMMLSDVQTQRASKLVSLVLGARDHAVLRMIFDIGLEAVETDSFLLRSAAARKQGVHMERFHGRDGQGLSMDEGLDVHGLTVDGLPQGLKKRETHG
jgi:hypothetical protein